MKLIDLLASFPKSSFLSEMSGDECWFAQDKDGRVWAYKVRPYYERGIWRTREGDNIIGVRAILDSEGNKYHDRCEDFDTTYVSANKLAIYRLISRNPSSVDVGYMIEPIETLIQTVDELGKYVELSDHVHDVVLAAKRAVSTFKRSNGQ